MEGPPLVVILINAVSISSDNTTDDVHCICDQNINYFVKFTKLSRLLLA